MAAEDQIAITEPRVSTTRWIIISAVGVLFATTFLIGTGLLEGFRFWLGVIGAPVAFWLMQVGLRRTTELRRFSNFIAALAMVWALCVLAVVAYNILTVGLVYTREASQIRKEQEDLRVGERMRAHGYAGLLEYKLACDKKEEHDTEKAAIAIKDTNALWDRIKEIRKERKKCAQRIIGADVPQVAINTPPTSTNATSIDNLWQKLSAMHMITWLLVMPLITIVGLVIFYTWSHKAGNVLIALSAIGFAFVAVALLLELDTSGALKINKFANANPNMRALFWAGIGFVWLIAFFKSVFGRTTHFWLLFFIPIAALLFNWLWWSKGVGVQVIQVVQNIRWL